MQISLSILLNIINIFYFDSHFVQLRIVSFCTREDTEEETHKSLACKVQLSSFVIINHIICPSTKKVRKLSLAMLRFDAMVLRECLERTHNFKLQLIFDFGFTLLLQLINLRDVFLCALVIFHFHSVQSFCFKIQKYCKTGVFSTTMQSTLQFATVK